MLRELHIAGLGVIDDITLELSSGLNVLTGETGAGKTMVTTGLALALGRRAQAHLVRAGAARARVEARFEAGGALVAEWAEDGDLVLARTVAPDGRSTARAGGQLAPLSTLAELGAGLVEVHGQHQTQRLLSPAAHVGFLDRYVGAEHLADLRAYRETYARLREATRRLEGIEEAGREREREKDLLAYQVREIEGLGLHPGEVADLSAEESRLSHAERILERLEHARSELDGSDALAGAAAALEEVARLDPGAVELSTRIASLAADAADATDELRAHTERVELDPARLEEVRERLAAIRGLERKYGEGEAGILAYLEEARLRLEGLQGEDDERERLLAQARALREETASLAAAVGERRAAAAPGLGAAIEAELRELGMEGAHVEVLLLSSQEPGPDGAESAELLLAGGPGQAPQPLAKVASGGELSRTMLGLRTVLADLDEIPTLVFDEVDAGIGGRAGVAVGRRLARLARSRQVLVVTHLPQIACFADHHVRVEKREGIARVEPLEEAERVEELSRMLSGMPTEEAATHAQQLLAEASREKSG